MTDILGDAPEPVSATNQAGDICKLYAIVDVIANAGDDDTISCLCVNISDGLCSRQWLRDAARDALLSRVPIEAASLTDVEEIKNILFKCIRYEATTEYQLGGVTGHSEAAAAVVLAIKAKTRGYETARPALATTPAKSQKADVVEAVARAMCDRVNGIGDYDENIQQRRSGWVKQAEAAIAAYVAATQPATSQERDDADRANGVGQDELVAGLKRALQHPAGDHDGWTDAGMEDAFFRWPVIVNALNEALSLPPVALDDACNEDGTTDFHRNTLPATSQEGEALMALGRIEACMNRLIPYLPEAARSITTSAIVQAANDFADLREHLAATPTPPTLSEDSRGFLTGANITQPVTVINREETGNGTSSWSEVRVNRPHNGQVAHCADQEDADLIAALINAALAQVKAS